MRLAAILMLSALPAAAAPPLHREGAFWVQTTDVSEKLPALMPLLIRGNGNVTVRGVAGHQVHYHLVRRVRARTESEARARLDGSGVSLLRRHGGMQMLLEGEPESELHVTLPRQVPRLALSTRVGDVEVADLDGSVQAGTGAGKVTVHRVKGGVVVDTQGGATSLGEIGGMVRIDSAGGTILADLLRGDAVLETGGGDIVVQRVNGAIRAFTAGGGIRIQEAGGLVTATTAGGPIQIVSARGKVTARNSGGPIQVGAAPGVNCESASGTIRLNDVSGAVHVETATGSIVAHLLPGAGLRDSFLSTMSGDITVFVPANVRLMLRAENEGSGDPRTITSEFPGLNIRSEAGSVRAEGAINGTGGPVLRLAGNGRIYIKKR